MSVQILLLSGVYVIGSIIGKTTGAYWGGRYSKAVSTVKNYLGFCLYQQGTIAIALLLMAVSAIIVLIVRAIDVVKIKR